MIFAFRLLLDFPLPRIIVIVVGRLVHRKFLHLMLASLSLMGLQDIHGMNALKTALVFFALSGIVNWPLAILMGAGGLLGGYFGAKYAKRVNQKYLRAFVVVMGLVASAYLFLRAV